MLSVTSSYELFRLHSLKDHFINKKTIDQIDYETEMQW